MSKTKEDVDFSKHLTPDDWGDPREPMNRKAAIVALTMLILYPICFGSGILVAHFLHW